jgi:hypothetical protein
MHFVLNDMPGMKPFARIRAHTPRASVIGPSRPVLTENAIRAGMSGEIG